MGVNIYLLTGMILQVGHSILFDPNISWGEGCFFSAYYEKALSDVNRLLFLSEYIVSEISLSPIGSVENLAKTLER